MADWRTIVSDTLERQDPHGDFSRVLPGPATAAAIDAVEKSIGHALPDELRSLYGVFNGIGLAGSDERDSPWLIVPVEALPEFMSTAATILAPTHSVHARRFLAFLDWGNGDVTGYMLDDDEKSVLPFLVTFQHELYFGEVGQDANDFFACGPESIVELFG